MTTRDEALEILNGLRTQHRDENWSKPDAPSWDESHVLATVGMSLPAFEKKISAEGYSSFEEFFIQSLVDDSET